VGALAMKREDIDDAFEWEDSYSILVALYHLIGYALEEGATDVKEGTDITDYPKLFKQVILLNEFTAQIDNGGFHQFFTNPQGDYALETFEILKEIGATNTVELFREALTIFPNGIPSTDHSTRDKQVDDSGEEGTQLLYSLDERYYNDDALLDIIATYFKKHRDEFYELIRVV
jgi:hypothetical protein